MPLTFRIDGDDCPASKNMSMPKDDAVFPLHYHHKVNSIWNYRGRTAGEAHLLVRQTDAAIGGASARSIEIYDGSTTVTLDNWFTYKIEAIESHSDSNQLFYVQLRDPRSIGETKFISNSYSLLTGTHEFTGTSSFTWQDVLDALWGELPTDAKGNSSTCPTLDYSPLSTAEYLNFDGISVWHAICKALAACGHVAVYDPVTSEFRFAKYDATQSGLSALYSSNASDLIWDGAIPTVGHTNAYANVVAVFQPVKHTTTSKGEYQPPYTATVATGSSGSSGTALAIVDTSLADPTASGATNTTQLSNRANDLKVTVNGISRAAASKSVKAYNGFISDFIPGEEVSCVVWAEHPRKGIYTEVSYYDMEGELDLPTPGRSNKDCDPIIDVFLDGLSLKQERCSGTIETIYTGTEC